MESIICLFLTYDQDVTTLTIDFIRLCNRSTHPSINTYIFQILQTACEYFIFLFDGFVQIRLIMLKREPVGRMTGIKYLSAKVSSCAMDFAASDSPWRSNAFGRYIIAESFGIDYSIQTMIKPLLSLKIKSSRYQNFGQSKIRYEWCPK